MSDYCRRCQQHIAYCGCTEIERMSDRIEELEAKALANKVAIMRLKSESARLRDALQAINNIDRSLLPKDCDFRVNAKRIVRAALHDKGTD